MLNNKEIILDTEEEVEQSVGTQQLAENVLLACQWLEYCHSLLPVLPDPDYASASALASFIKPTMTKARILSIVAAIVDAITIKEYSVDDLTESQRTYYKELLANEAVVEAAMDLLEPYLVNCTPSTIVDNCVDGRLYPSHGTGAAFKQLCKQRNWVIQSSEDIAAIVDADYNLVEEAYKLMTIKVC